jgi:hypothetical protein
VRRYVRVLVLRENGGIILLAYAYMCGKRVWLRNLFDRFQIATAICHGKDLPRSVGTHSLDRGDSHRRTGAVLEGETEAGRHPVLEYFKDDHADGG